MKAYLAGDNAKVVGDVAKAIDTAAQEFIRVSFLFLTQNLGDVVQRPGNPRDRKDWGTNEEFCTFAEAQYDAELKVNEVSIRYN